MNVSLFGKEDIVVHRRIDIILIPCIPEQLTKDNAHLQKELCLADYNNKTDLERKKQESIAYVKEPNLVFLLNLESIDTSKFGKETFKYESHFKN